MHCYTWRILVILIFSPLLLNCATNIVPCSSTPTPTGLINADILLNDLKILSSDAMQGRKTGTHGGFKAKRFIQQRFSEIKLNFFEESYHHPFTYDFNNFRQGNNIIGWKKGKQKAEQYIVITAHYDHLGQKGNIIYNGADDNASGVAAMLSLAEYLKNKETHHSVIFVATDAEELGLHGAKAFIKNPPIALERIKLNINLDMLAQSGKRKKLYIAGTRNNPQLKAIADATAYRSDICLKTGHDGRSRNKDSFLNVINWKKASDHALFYKSAINYLYFGVDIHRHYHQPSDTIETINPAFYTSAVEAITTAFLLVDELNF